MSELPIRINWLPLRRNQTVEVARLVEDCGFEGMGICDSPRGIELYTAIEASLAATSSISVGANVTNPRTRPWHVHAAAMRAMLEHGRRGFLGFGTGDSAVRTHGGRPATLAELGECIGQIGCAVDDPAPILVAASGPKTGWLGRDIADGVVAGVGASGPALRGILGDDLGDGQRWATLRIAIANDEDDLDLQRSRVLPRAISAARFAFARTFEGKDVPDPLHQALRSGFAQYDFAAHGVSGDTPNARLFADRPDIEEYLLERFAIVDTPARACERIRSLAGEGFTGVYLSIVFEDPLAELERIATALSMGGILRPRSNDPNRGNR